MSKKKNTPRKSVLPRQMIEELISAEEFLESGRPDKARAILEELDRKRPNQPDILASLVNACYDMQDMRGYEWAIYRLVRLEPKDSNIALGLAGAYLENLRPALALNAFEHLLQRWPEHERSADARKTITELYPALLEQKFNPQLSDEEFVAMALGNDEVRFFMDHEQVQQGKSAAEKLLKRYPDFVPVLNNLTLLYILQGDQRRAIETVQRALEIEPQNIHALGNLIHVRFLSGDIAGAQENVPRLLASQAPAADAWTKKAEALSLLGDDQGILGLYEQAKQAGEFELPIVGVQFYHFTAVALANTEQEEEARRLWKEALKREPSFEIARQNLEDLAKPAHERNGAWAMPFSSWVSPKVVTELSTLLSRPTKSNKEKGGKDAARRFLQQHPEFEVLFPHMLARGDANTRQFIFYVTQWAKTPELLDMLRKFALGQSGSDKQRMEFAQLLTDNDWLPTGPCRFWQRGEWREVLLMSFEISPEPIQVSQSRAVRDLTQQALNALGKEDGFRAQTLIEQALELEPNSPTLHNNLAMALILQDRMDEAEAKIRDLHIRFPDYFFGIANVALMEIRAGNLEAARQMLNGLMQRKKFHTSEYDLLCRAFIELALAEENMDVARSWLEMWRKVSPDHPQLEYYEEQVNGPKKRKRFWER